MSSTPGGAGAGRRVPKYLFGVHCLQHPPSVLSIGRDPAHGPCGPRRQRPAARASRNLARRPVGRSLSRERKQPVAAAVATHPSPLVTSSRPQLSTCGVPFHFSPALAAPSSQLAPANSSSPAMSNPTPRFWAGPLRYCHWAARERPAYLYSVLIGAAGPLMLVTVPPIQERLGYKRAPPVPMTYPGTFCANPPDW